MAAKRAKKKEAMAAGLPILECKTAKDWDRWLSKHVGVHSGVALKLGKKGNPHIELNYSDALDIALAWGWIDSQKLSFDEHCFLQRFTPRKKQSPWSKINVKRAEALIEKKLMKPSGLAEVTRAKEDGRWAKAYDSQRNATVPPDLIAALNTRPKAKAFFEQLDRVNRYAILFRLHQLKTEAGRAKRVAAFVDMLNAGKTLHLRPEKRT